MINVLYVSLLVHTNMCTLHTHYTYLTAPPPTTLLPNLFCPFTYKCPTTNSTRNKAVEKRNWRKRKRKEGREGGRGKKERKEGEGKKERKEGGGKREGKEGGGKREGKEGGGKREGKEGGGKREGKEGGRNILDKRNTVQFRR